jgi:hypothetical protein
VTRARTTILAVAAALVAVGAGTASGKDQGPFPLMTLPSLGSVAWECRQGPATAWSLTFRMEELSATTVVSWTAAGARRRLVTMQPGERLTLPFVTVRAQRLAFDQRTKPGTLRARLRIDFPPGPRGCYPYDPPTVVARVLARR